MIAWRTSNDCFWCESVLASVVNLLRWSPDDQLTIAFAANPCGFCRESFAVIAWRTTNDCFCCESLRLLSWVFCRDRLTNDWRLLLLRILAACVVSLLRWSPYEQQLVTIAFAANPCGFCRESLRWSPYERLTIAFAANPWGLCRESFVVIALRTTVTNDCFCCESLRLLSWVFCADRLTNNSY